MTILRKHAVDAWARSNMNFILGFNERLKGNLPEAERYQRESYNDSPGNFSAVRELAAVCLLRNDIDSAEIFAREAFQHAPDNPYVLDILLSVLIKMLPTSSNRTNPEIESLFERLKIVGEEEGHSFYTTRRAEYELKAGSVGEACKLIDEAKERTPNIFGVRALRAEIYLERGNKTIAWDEIRFLQSLVSKNTVGERSTNLRPLKVLEASYYTAIGKFEEAKDLFRNRNIFTDKEAADEIKKIEIEQGFRKSTRS